MHASPERCAWQSSSGGWAAAYSVERGAICGDGIEKTGGPDCDEEAPLTSSPDEEVGKRGQVGCHRTLREHRHCREKAAREGAFEVRVPYQSMHECDNVSWQEGGSDHTRKSVIARSILLSVKNPFILDKIP